jgi:pyruvate dehydrogenase E2 component (dihydrolipoamide acetyltransferase)
VGDFVMPALGSGMESGTLVAWRKRVGDPVKRGDIIAEVETEKGLIEVECFEAGVVTEIVVAEGTKVPVGMTLARIGAAGTVPAAALPVSAPPPMPAAAPVSVTDAVSMPVSAAPPTPAPTAPLHRATPAARHLARELGLDADALPGSGAHGIVSREDVVAAAARALPSEGRPKISPLARRRAAELGVDLAALTPSAADGAIHVSDVKNATRAARPPAEPRATAPDAGGMRRAIAVAMSKSKREIPHYYVSHTVDLGPAMAWLAAENERRSVHERLLPGVLLLRATARALAKHRALNGHFIDGTARPSDRVHLGVAVALKTGGLVAPAIHDADTRTISELMDAFKDLVTRARAGQLRSSELTDPTATVTSLGDRGVEAVFPIINPPEVAMIGFGKIVERPWVVGGAIVPRPVVTVTLAADHRVSDGHDGGLFLATIESLLMEQDEP